jgi:hypothetical protein
MPVLEQHMSHSLGVGWGAMAASVCREPADDTDHRNHALTADRGDPRPRHLGRPHMGSGHPGSSPTRSRWAFIAAAHRTQQPSKAKLELDVVQRELVCVGR